MNMAIFYVLKWEKELEIRRSARVPCRQATESVEPHPRVRRPKRRWDPTRKRDHRRRACECP